MIYFFVVVVVWVRITGEIDHQHARWHSKLSTSWVERDFHETSVHGVWRLENQLLVNHYLDCGELEDFWNDFQLMRMVIMMIFGYAYCIAS